MQSLTVRLSGVVAALTIGRLAPTPLPSMSSGRCRRARLRRHRVHLHPRASATAINRHPAPNRSLKGTDSQRFAWGGVDRVDAASGPADGKRGGALVCDAGYVEHERVLHDF